MDEAVFGDAFAELASIIGKRPPDPDADYGMMEAIASILGYFGITPPAAAHDDLMEISEEIQVEAMLRPSGCMRRKVELKGKWWKSGVDPFLGATADGRLIALLPQKWGGYAYEDPQTGEKVRISASNAASIGVDAFCFYRPFPQSAMGFRDLLAFMAKCVRLRDILFVVGLGLGITLIGMLLPYASSQLYSVVLPSGDKGNIFAVGALLAGVALSATMLSLARSLSMRRISTTLVNVENASIMRMLSLPTRFFTDYSAGESASRLSSISGICAKIASAALTTGFSFLFAFAYIFQMRSYAPSLVAPGMLILLLMLLLSLATTLLRMRIGRERLRLDAKQSALLYTLISGIQKIKISGAKKRAFAKWSKLYGKIGKLQYQPPALLRLGGTINLAVSLGGTLLLYFVAALSSVSMAEYIAFTAAYGALTGAIMGLTDIAGTIADIRANLERAQPIFDARPELSLHRKQITNISGAVEVSHISFRYQPDGPLILDDVNMRIKSGEYIAIVGKTGCGKSTLLRLLLGFEQPESGSIFFNGLDINTLDLRMLRQCMGVDLQNGKLIAGSIFQNIVISAPWKSLEDAWEAAELAGIAQDIRDMPMGMHTMISESGGGVSGGQKQRLLIARALINKPRLLLFDEATSALDNISQKHIADALAGLRSTRIIIAHRLSTVRHCDRIFVLDKGRVIEEGGYEALMEKQGFFYELVKRQTL